jgi:hypothetical protein
MNPSERIDRLIAELTDWRGPTKSRMLALTAIYAENKTILRTGSPRPSRIA